MASRPGAFTEWPWSSLGNFKYLLVTPFVIASIHSYVTAEHEKKDLGRLMVVVLMLWRLVHNQIWITVSRQMMAMGKKMIVDKPIEFEQVDRERTWDDQIIFNTLFMYLVNIFVPGSSCIPLWKPEGAILVALLHTGPVEFLYYWFHRALHHHFLYTRYHSHHHSSIVTEPITSVVHPFAEHVVYTLLFAIPMVTASLCGVLSIVSFVGYITYIDFMNNMGHCNFELVPKRLFHLFPPLKLFCYTPSYHSLHHTQFRTNYSLFMPIYDYIYGTTDKSSDSLYERSLERKEETPNVIHLTHFTTLDSIYQMRLGFPSLASHPLWSQSPWYLTYFMRPFTLLFSFLFTSSRTFVFERNRLHNLTLHSHLLPKFTFHYKYQCHHESINNLIEGAILEADKKGVKVLSLGLMNNSEELNGYGEMYVQKHPKLKIRLVDGSSMAAAVVLNSIPKETTEVVFRGNPTKVALAVVFSLCQRGVKVVVLRAEEHNKLIINLYGALKKNLVAVPASNAKVWLVGDGLEEEEHMKAKEGTLFIPFSQFPPNKLRKDCFYHSTPAMHVPKSAQNIDSCENWLERRVMSAWRVGGIVHALEGWEEHDCGNTCNFSSLQTIWEAALRHDFQPLLPPYPGANP